MRHSSWSFVPHQASPLEVRSLAEKQKKRELFLNSLILDFLKQKNIPATFFCVGSNIKRYPELFKRIKKEGHSVGNHTMNHDKGTKVSFSKYKDSISETRKLVDTKLFRPPYGRINSFKSKKLAKDYQLVMWSWLSYDFDPTIPISTILEKARKQIKAGDILVLHDNPKVTDRVKELLPQLIEIIEEKGLKFEKIKD